MVYKRQSFILTNLLIKIISNTLKFINIICSTVKVGSRKTNYYKTNLLRCRKTIQDELEINNILSVITKYSYLQNNVSYLLKAIPKCNIPKDNNNKLVIGERT